MQAKQKQNAASGANSSDLTQDSSERLVLALEEQLRLKDAAIDELQHSLDKAAETMRHGASLLQDMSLTAQALDEISAELCKQQLTADAWIRFGEIYYSLNSAEDAQRFFARALAVDPSCVDALNNLAVLNYSQGNADLAETYFFRALEINPRRGDVRENLRRLYSTYPEKLETPRADGVMCPCCAGQFPKFIPGGVTLRPNAMCPACESLERHRLMRLYFDSRTNLFKARLKVLHFAPEQCLEQALDNNPDIDYISADLYSPRAKEKIDITEIPYPDDSFDVVLCSHVLEHIPNDRRAMRELRRVLKPDGWALLQVPIDKKRALTFEDPSVTDPEERKRLFGQHDHVRWYGLDYPVRLAECGFTVRIDRFMNELGAETVQRFGLGLGEDMYFCTKNLQWLAPSEEISAKCSEGVTPTGTSKIRSLPLPPQELRFMNEDDAKFIKVGSDNLALMVAQGFTAQSRLLDIGSGYGRLPSAIIRDMEFTGQYHGVDILPRHIDWCVRNITPAHPKFHFQVMDVKNDRYNPGGKYQASEYVLPFEGESFDFTVLFSVFTHMYEDDIANYLRQIHRVLKPGGRCMATFFLLDELRLPAAVAATNPLCMKYAINAYTRYHNPADKLHAISFHKEFVTDLIQHSGFRVLDLCYGSWAGGSGSYQDVVVFEK